MHTLLAPIQTVIFKVLTLDCNSEMRAEAAISVIFQHTQQNDSNILFFLNEKGSRSKMLNFHVIYE